MKESELDERIARDNTPLHIANEIIEQIHRYPGLFKSKEAVLKGMFLQGSYSWKNGELINNDSQYSDDKEYRITLTGAKWIYIYGYQNHNPIFSNYSLTYDPLFNIPKDITPEWLDVVKDFVFYINNLKEKEYKLQVLAYYVKAYGINNPHSIISYNSACEDFKKLREFTNQLAKDRDWEWMTLETLHNPAKVRMVNKEFNDMITGILDEAEGFVDGAIKSLKKQDAKTYVRRYGVEIFEEVIKEMKEVKG